ncbi:hypothetical protein ACRJ4B_15290 [Streptomyces sp. GTA36]
MAPSVRAEGASTAVTASPPVRVGMRVRITTGPELGPHREPDGGPFWVTMELFMRDTEGYRVAADESFLNERTVEGSTASTRRYGDCARLLHPRAQM